MCVCVCLCMYVMWSVVKVLCQVCQVERLCACAQLRSAEVQRLEQELQALSAERDAMTLQHQQTLSKLQTLTEYFESKEQNLHRRLGREEMARQEMEGREASAKELVMAAEEERTREK